jgi:hypothetical protein
MAAMFPAGRRGNAADSAAAEERVCRVLAGCNYDRDQAVHLLTGDPLAADAKAREWAVANKRGKTPTRSRAGGDAADAAGGGAVGGGAAASGAGGGGGGGLGGEEARAGTATGRPGGQQQQEAQASRRMDMRRSAAAGAGAPMPMPGMHRSGGIDVYRYTGSAYAFGAGYGGSSGGGGTGAVNPYGSGTPRAFEDSVPYAEETLGLQRMNAFSGRVAAAAAPPPRYPAQPPLPSHPHPSMLLASLLAPAASAAPTTMPALPASDVGVMRARHAALRSEREAHEARAAALRAEEAAMDAALAVYSTREALQAAGEAQEAVRAAASAALSNADTRLRSGQAELGRRCERLAAALADRRRMLEAALQAAHGGERAHVDALRTGVPAAVEVIAAARLLASPTIGSAVGGDQPGVTREAVDDATNTLHEVAQQLRSFTKLTRRGVLSFADESGGSMEDRLVEMLASFGSVTQPERLPEPAADAALAPPLTGGPSAAPLRWARVVAAVLPPPAPPGLMNSPPAAAPAASEATCLANTSAAADGAPPAPPPTPPAPPPGRVTPDSFPPLPRGRAKAVAGDAGTCDAASQSSSDDSRSDASSAAEERGGANMF